jgi:hypothetical protein
MAGLTLTGGRLTTTSYILMHLAANTVSQQHCAFGK